MDDLAKLTNDFFCAPEIPINEKYYSFFISEMTNNFDLDDDYIFRVKNLLYSYKLKWVCIMVKQLTSTGILKRNELNIDTSTNTKNRELKKINLKIDELEKQFNMETS